LPRTVNLEKGLKRSEGLEIQEPLDEMDLRPEETVRFECS